MPADIILLGAIAAFVLLRLYGVLGQKIGHDQPPVKPDVVKKEERVIHLKPVEATMAAADAPAEAAIVPEEPSGLYAPDVESGVASLRKLDPQFRMKDFLDGAKVAFDMVHEAFRKDDRETLKFLLSKDIFKDFASELDKRKAQSEHTESTLVSILTATPREVEVEKNKGRISVAFSTEQMFVNRDADGRAIEGSSSDVQRIEDEWVFERDMRSSNPNWVVVAT